MWAAENDFDAAVQVSAMRNGVDPFLIKAVIGQESQFSPRAYRVEAARHDASRGLMQILLATAQDHGYSGSPDGLFDPATNIEYGTRTLKAALDRAPDLPSAVSRYNGGYNPNCGFGLRATAPGKCCIARDSTGRCIRYGYFKAGEFGNQGYVDKVLANYAYFQSKTASTLAPPPVPTAPARPDRVFPVKAAALGGAGLLALAGLLYLFLRGQR